MSIQVFTAGKLIDMMVPGWEPERDGLGMYPFTLRVAVIQSRPPRHNYFEFTRDLGSGLMDKIFMNRTGMTKGPDTKLVFVFPERHMSVHEQRGFMNALVNHQEVDHIIHVDIVTSSPIILSDFPNNVIQIISFPEDHGVYIGA